MKVSGINVTHVNMPFDAPFWWTAGLYGDVIKGSPFRQTNDTVRVPEGPGLSVELDPDAMKQWAAHFKTHGQIDHFHNPAQPGVYRRLPLH